MATNNTPKPRKSREQIKQTLLNTDPTRDYHSTRFTYYGEMFVQQLPQWRLWTGRMMLTSDPLVNFSLNVRNAALMAAEVVVTAKNPVIMKWVQDQWNLVWNHHRPKMVSAKKWGFSALQVLFKQDQNGLLSIKSLKDFAPEDTRALESGSKLCGYRVKGEKLFFPQGCWLTFNSEFGSPYGTGCLRRSYPAWYEKWMDHGAKRLLQLRMIKDAYIGDIFWYPPNMQLSLPDGTMVSWKDLMREMGENRLSGGAMTLPKFFDEQGHELTDYTPPQDIGTGSQIFDWVEHCDEGILRGADIPTEVIRAADTGSGFSGRSIPFLVVLSVCTNELVEIIQCFNEQVLRPLAWLNWGGEPEYDIVPKSLVESFAADASGSPLGGSALGAPASMRPYVAPQVINTSQGPVAQYSETNQQSVEQLAKHLENKYGLEQLWLSHHPYSNSIKIDNIIVPKNQRGQGIGTRVVQDIQQHAKSTGHKVVLTPGVRDSATGTTSQSRLKKWYRNLGFIKNQDYRVSASLAWHPDNTFQYSEQELSGDPRLDRLIRLQARKLRLTPEQYHDAMHATWSERSQYHSDREQAKSLIKAHISKNARGMQSQANRGGDEASIPGLDEIGREVAESYPSLGWGGGIKDQNTRSEQDYAALAYKLAQEYHKPLPSRYSREYHNEIEKHVEQVHGPVHERPTPSQAKRERKRRDTDSFDFGANVDQFEEINGRLYHKNLPMDQLTNLALKYPSGSLRGVRLKNGDYHTWNGYNVIHEQAISDLGLKHSDIHFTIDSPDARFAPEKFKHSIHALIHGKYHPDTKDKSELGLQFEEPTVATNTIIDANKKLPETEQPQYSSTQFNLGDDLAYKVLRLAYEIPDHDLAEDGRETQPHITLKYGLHTNDPEVVRQVVQSQAPIAVKLGKCSCFLARDNSSQRGGCKYDVVKIEVVSQGIMALNKYVSGHLEHTDTFPNYLPHITIAYVKPGLGQIWANRLNNLEGTVVAFDRVIFSNKDRQHTEILLTGDAQFEEDKKIRVQNVDNFWLSPTGEIKSLGSSPSHDHYARKRGSDILEMMKQGWHRGVVIGKTISTHNEFHPPTIRQRSKLIDHAIENKHESIIHDNGEDDRVIWHKDDQFMEYNEGTSKQGESQFAENITSDRVRAALRARFGNRAPIEDEDAPFKSHKEKYGEAKDPDDAGYILPSGYLLDLKRTKPGQAIVHEDVEHGIPGMLNRGAIRIRTAFGSKQNRAAHIQALHHPTPAQVKQIKNTIDRHGHVHLELGAFNKHYHIDNANRLEGDLRALKEGRHVAQFDEDNSDCPCCKKLQQELGGTSPSDTTFRQYSEIQQSELTHSIGTAPIPEDHIRVFHYTRGNPEDIRKQGLLVSKSRGSTYGEPNVIWGSSNQPDHGHNIVEFHIHPKDPAIRLGGAYQNDPTHWTKSVNHVALERDIQPHEIIGVHEPWHHKYHYAKKNPKVLEAIHKGEHDDLLSNKEYGPAIKRIKEEHASQHSEFTKERQQIVSHIIDNSITNAHQTSEAKTPEEKRKIALGSIQDSADANGWDLTDAEHKHIQEQIKKYNFQYSEEVNDGDKYFNDAVLHSFRNQDEKSRSRLVYLHPQHFLDLATHTTGDPSKTKGVEEILAKGTKFDSIPSLYFQHDGEGQAQVTGHEGRHRALALLKRGVTKIPVELRSVGGKGQTIRWGAQSSNHPFDTIQGTWPHTIHGQDKLDNKPHKSHPFPVADLRTHQHSECCEQFVEKEDERTKRIREFAQSEFELKVQSLLDDIRSLSPNIDQPSLADLITQRVHQFGTEFGESLWEAAYSADLIGRAEVADLVPSLPELQPHTVNIPPVIPPKSSIGEAGDAPEPRVVLPAVDRAINVLRTSPVSTGVNYLDTAEKVKQGMFAVTTEISDKAVQDIREILADNIAQGLPRRDFMEQVAEHLEANVLAPNHVETIFRTNIMSAYSNARMDAMSNSMVSTQFPYAQYWATTDGRVRPEHMAMESLGLNGTNIYRMNDPVFKEFRPPWGYNCRCSWNPTDVQGAAEQGVREAKEWLQRAKEMAQQRGGHFAEYLKDTAPLEPEFVKHPPFEAPPAFKRN